MKEYQIKLENGKVFNASYIGLNHDASGNVYENTFSSYNKYFDNNDEVLVEYNSKDIRYIKLGDIKEAYQLLRDAICAKTPRSVSEYTECVIDAIIRYFGVASDIKKQESFYDKIEKDSSGKKIVYASSLVHKSVATSIERAMVAQNLLIECGILSVFKVSGAMIDGKNTIHAFNLINNEGKYCIFDSTIPTIKNGKIHPIILEIPEEVYLKIINPTSDIGYSVKVKYLNSLQNKECDITYDAGRNNLYIPDKEKVKKLV